MTSPSATPLTHVFGRLLHEKRLREEELRGLREDKLKSIRSLASIAALFSGGHPSSPVSKTPSGERNVITNR